MTDLFYEIHKESIPRLFPDRMIVSECAKRILEMALLAPPVQTLVRSGKWIGGDFEETWILHPSEGWKLASQKITFL